MNVSKNYQHPTTAPSLLKDSKDKDALLKEAQKKAQEQGSSQNAAKDTAIKSSQRYDHPATAASSTRQNQAKAASNTSEAAAQNAAQIPENKGSALISQTLKSTGIELGKDELKSLTGKQLSNLYAAKALESSHKESSNQLSAFASSKNKSFGDFKALVDKAKEMVSEDGFFGVKETSKRIADFIINLAGDDLGKLEAGKKGMLQGFAQAGKAFGDVFGSTFSHEMKDNASAIKGGESLPKIAHETMNAAIEKVDSRIAELGGHVVDLKA